MSATTMESVGQQALAEGLLQWDTAVLLPEAPPEQGAEAPALQQSSAAQCLNAETQAHEDQLSSDADQIRVAIRRLSNISSGALDHLAALAELRALVELPGNSEHLSSQGGIAALVAQLASLSEHAAGVLATAAANNPRFQAAVLHDAPGVMFALLQVISSGDAAAASEGLRAVGSLLQAGDAGMHAFLIAGGINILSRLLPQAAGPFKLRTLRVLVDVSIASRRDAEVLQIVLKQASVPTAIVDLLSSSDVEQVEGTLLAVQALLRGSAEARPALRSGYAGDAAEKLHERLLQEDSKARRLPGPSAAAADRQRLVQLARDVANALSGPTEGADGRALRTGRAEL